MSVTYSTAPLLSQGSKRPSMGSEMIVNSPDKLNAIVEPEKVGKHAPLMPISPLEQIKMFQEHEKHTDVLNLLNSLKKKDISMIDADIIALAVTSATATKQPLTIVSLIDLGLTQGIKINPELALAYIKACRECASDSQPGMWSKAVGMLETMLANGNGRVQTGKKVKNTDNIAQCFEESVVLCANSGKWRNALDIIEKATASNCPLTDRMLSAAIVCCAREVNGLAPAHDLFRYMGEMKIPRSAKVYSALLKGFVKDGLLDKYEATWVQMKAENVPCTDTLYATRIQAYAALGHTDKAEATLQESLSIKIPKQSYNALYFALLKSGDTQKALDLVKKMKGVGVQPPEQHNATFHIQSLSKVGLVSEGLKFLRKQEEEHYSYYLSVTRDSSSSSCANTNTVDVAVAPMESNVEDMGSVTDAAWQSLFKGCLSHGNFAVAEEVLAFAAHSHALRKKRLNLNTSFPSPPPMDTSLWLSQLISALGKAGDWGAVLRAADE